MARASTASSARRSAVTAASISRPASAGTSACARATISATSCSSSSAGTGTSTLPCLGETGVSSKHGRGYCAASRGMRLRGHTDRQVGSDHDRPPEAGPEGWNAHRGSRQSRWPPHGQGQGATRYLTKANPSSRTDGLSTVCGDRQEGPMNEFLDLEALGVIGLLALIAVGIYLGGDAILSSVEGWSS